LVQFSFLSAVYSAQNWLPPAGRRTPGAFVAERIYRLISVPLLVLDIQQINKQQLQYK